MSNMTKIVYLTEEQFEQLKQNGTITVDGKTIEYDENYLYLTPADDVNEIKAKLNEVIDFVNEWNEYLTGIPTTHIIHIFGNHSTTIAMIFPTEYREAYTDNSFIEDMQRLGYSNSGSFALATGTVGGKAVIGCYASGGDLYAVFADTTYELIQITNIVDNAH